MLGPEQSYRLSIGEDQISIIASDAAGVFYAHQTLNQLKREFPESLPAMVIEDSPDFAVRGFMLDISRDKVPTMATLFALVDLLSELKINQLQLYTEHTFAYREHRVVWQESSPMTGDEIRQLDSYCRKRFIELVPNQNSFGHLERWFKHAPYQHLAEKPEGFSFSWGTRAPNGFSLNPTDPRSMKFIESLYDELLPNFTSGLFNVGCDETLDLGLGRSKADVERRGRERVYFDFLVKIYEAVKRRGKRMMFWGDIILHKPELLNELPRDIIALNWGYEADHPFEKEMQAIRNSRVPFYVCPGTSSWCSISGRTDNAIANLQNAAKHGIANGASGYLITDWGDYGHLQYQPVSYIGIAAGAAYSWSYEANRRASLEIAIDMHVFADRAEVMTNWLGEFGNIYQCAKEPLSNGSRFFWTLVGGEDRRKNYQNVTIEEFEQAIKRIDQLLPSLQKARMDHSDADLVLAECRNAAAMLRHACRHGIFLGRGPIKNVDLAGELQKIMAEHRRLWLLRNRPGGLNDSITRLSSSLSAYRAKS